MTNTVIADRYAAFQYNTTGATEGLTTPLEHLAISQAHNVVANGKRKQLPTDTIVLNYAQSCGRWYAQVGIATGNSVAESAAVFWPNWSNPNSTVFEVVWLTKIVTVPSELASKRSVEMPLSQVEAVVNYVLRNTR